MKFTPHAIALSVALVFVGLTGCSKDAQDGQAAAQQMPPTTVDVQVIELNTLPITNTFSGRTTAFESSEVRPQVSGIIDEILFQEGSMVQAGQPLYRINPDNYTSSAAANEAALNQARANVGTARASLIAQQATYEQARADLARLEGLLEVEAISRQAYDQAITAVKTAQAGVEQARANLASSEATVRSAEASLSASRLDLNRTIVRAPISGQSGISSVTKGALVSSGQAASLVTISRLDPIYVDISQSSAEMLRLRQQLASGQASQGSTDVQLVLEDGTVYPATGKLALANAQVDEATGAMTLRAVFPNPDGVLLPGMYVNARLNQSMVANAALLPQTAVMRNAKGETQVYIVNAENKIEVRNIVTSGTNEGKWIVTEGLKTGDKVVVMGTAKVKPEQAVEVRTLPNTTTTNATAQNREQQTTQSQANLGKNSVFANNNAANANTGDNQANTPPTTQPSTANSLNSQNTAQGTLSADEQEAMAAADATQ